MSVTPLNLLLQDLKGDDSELRDAAIHQLWQRWFEQKGTVGLQLLRRSQTFQEQGNFDEAEAILSQTIRSMPDFAEAWNRRAVMYFIQERYRKAISDCQQTLILNPVHFGALHGMGLSYLKLGEYRQASQAFRQALTLQPYSIENQRMLLECMVHLG